MDKEREKPPRILLVEDNKADIRLTEEAFKESEFRVQLDVVTDGEQALDYLYMRNDYKQALRPNVILLDINLPKKTGLEVLSDVKANESLKKIPIIVLTTSDANSDITKAYSLHANCYIIKPVDFDDFAKVIKMVEAYWFNTVQLPVA